VPIFYVLSAVPTVYALPVFLAVHVLNAAHTLEAHTLEAHALSNLHNLLVAHTVWRRALNLSIE